MTKIELLNTLLAFPGCTFVSMETATVPKMLKRGNPLIGKEVIKHCKITGQIGSDYGHHVNNERFAEYGDEIPVWEPAKMAWGEHVSNCSLIEHKGKYYLRVIVKDMKWRFFTVDGEPVPDDVVTCWIPKRKESSRQDLPTEKQVICRNYSLDSIVKINWFRREDEIAA